MDINKFTQKSQEALHDAQAKALMLGHTEVDAEHLVLAMIKQEQGLVGRLLAKMNINVPAFQTEIETELSKRATAAGGVEQGKTYITQRLNKFLIRADEEAKRLKDEYISVEHIFLSMIEEVAKTPLSKIFQTFNIT